MNFQREHINEHIKDYDSLKFYKDADWATLKGKSEIFESSFEYPFLCYSFRNTDMDVLFFFTANRVIRWHFKKYNDLFYTRLKHYDKEIRDTVWNYFIYHSGGNLQLNCLNADLFSDKIIDVKSVVKTIALDSLTIKQHLYLATYGSGQFSSKDIVNFDTSELSKKLNLYSETTLRMNDNKLYQTRYYRKEDNRETINEEIIVKDSDFKYSSFLYYYVNVFRTWDPVLY